MTLTRLSDWQTRLHRYLCSTRGRAMQPGQHDCCLFGAGAIEAVTGVDLAADWRGRYTTLAGGQRALKKAGYADHIALIAAHLPEAHPSEALAGDIAIVSTEAGPAVGVVQGAVVYVLHAAGGIGLVPMSIVQHLFKVG